ncbi:hypothetical protein NDU88_002305 [Pleurodeles waltl]|uniref:Uncharacterized protein n=1 Tax=Pleurodeles waltl TaxID=8319 RepID=A0AAV7MR88_PLEWA|nr:hypothetical protein NDU88_002305 [Pleurodeles waltl]
MQGPTECLTFLGIEIDSTNGDKVTALQADIRQVLMDEIPDGLPPGDGGDDAVQGGMVGIGSVEQRIVALGELSLAPTTRARYRISMGKLKIKQTNTIAVAPDPDEIKREDTGDSEGMALSLQSQFDRILSAIADTKATLQQDIGTVSVRPGLLRAENHTFADRVKEVKVGLGEVQLVQANLAQ